jgi:hypothetical protein
METPVRVRLKEKLCGEDNSAKRTTGQALFCKNPTTGRDCGAKPTVRLGQVLDSSIFLDYSPIDPELKVNPQVGAQGQGIRISQFDLNQTKRAMK